MRLVTVEFAAVQDAVLAHSQKCAGRRTQHVFAGLVALVAVRR